MTTIMIADDHPIFLSGLHDFLGDHGLEVIRCARDADAALARIEEARPDIAILDISMPGGGGMKVLRCRRQAGDRMPILFLTVSIAREDAMEAMKLGIDGIVLKTSDPNLLLTCIDAILAGESWFDPDIVQTIFENRQANAPQSSIAALLTGREQQIAMLVADGMRNREIAQRFLISEGTVKVHLYNIYRKLSIKSRSELILRLFSEGSAPG